MIRYDPPHQKLMRLHASAFFAMHNDNENENENENDNDTSEEVVRIYILPLLPPLIYRQLLANGSSQEEDEEEEIIYFLKRKKELSRR